MPVEVPLRVFVSHSSQEDEAVLAAIVAAFDRNERLTLLMDTEDLEAGDPWRARINLWLGSCDAAVVVLSAPALDKPWVLYETAILSYRNRNDRFLIVPVLLNDPEGKLLGDRRLDAPHISEIQAIRESDPAAIADAVVQKLATYQARERRPIDAAVSRIRAILDDLPRTLIDDAERCLRTRLPWEPGRDPLVPLAEKLLSAPVEDAIDALYVIREHVTDRKRLKTLIDLVGSSWVDPKAIEELPEIAGAPSCRAVALNAAFSETARMYQVAACPTNRSYFVSCGDVFPDPGDALPDEIVAKVEEALRIYMKAPTVAEMRASLLRADRTIVFAGVPAVGFTEEVVERLQSEFPTVTFFFLTGEYAAPAGAVERKLLKLIVPQLREKEEEAFRKNLERLNGNVFDTLDWSSS